jgi:hypothetical protein
MHYGAKREAARPPPDPKLEIFCVNPMAWANNSLRQLARTKTQEMRSRTDFSSSKFGTQIHEITKFRCQLLWSTDYTGSFLDERAAASTKQLRLESSAHCCQPAESGAC